MTVIHPISVVKKIYWLNQETGAITGGRCSPKKGNAYDVFRELYKIRPYLQNPNLSIHIFLMDMEEYKVRGGYGKDKKRGSFRYDRLPGNLRDIVRIETKEDYRCFLPDGLPELFTSLDMAKCSHISRSTAQTCLLILRDLGIVELVGKRGRANLHKIVKYLTVKSFCH